MNATKLDFVDKEFDTSVISFGLHDMPPEASCGLQVEKEKPAYFGLLPLPYAT